MSLLGHIANSARWPSWPPQLYRIARRRVQAEAWRKQMQRFAELDPRFAADVGLTSDEVSQGRSADRANGESLCEILGRRHGDDH